jgi:hypothetical protein
MRFGELLFVKDTGSAADVVEAEMVVGPVPSWPAFVREAPGKFIRFAHLEERFTRPRRPRGPLHLDEGAVTGSHDDDG